MKLKKKRLGQNSTRLPIKLLMAFFIISIASCLSLPVSKEDLLAGYYDIENSVFYPVDTISFKRVTISSDKIGFKYYEIEFKKENNSYVLTDPPREDSLIYTLFPTGNRTSIHIYTSDILESKEDSIPIYYPEM